MMDVQSPTCFRSAATTLPRNPSSNTLTLPPHSSPRSDTAAAAAAAAAAAKYTYQRSNSFTTGNMVVESQALNFRPMTPDPHPDNARKAGDTGKSTLPESRQQNLSLPPEGALAPEEEPPMKKQKLVLPNDSDFVTKENEYLSSIQRMSNFVVSPTEGSKQDDKSDVMPNVNGLKAMKEFMNGNGELDFGDNLNKHKMDSSLLEAAFKLGFDKSPPALSPKTMSDTDLDCASTGSPSVTGERRRRKPNLEDIVRRMKEVETDYYSEDSDDCQEDELMRQHMNGEDGMDEVDGDYTMARMPVLNNQIDPDTHIKSDNSVHKGELSPAQKDSDLNENNNVIHKTKTDADGKEIPIEENGNGKDGDIADIENKGIPLPPSSKPDQPGVDGEANGAQSNNTTPQKMTGSNWLRGAFNNFPMFPFQASPPELPFANFMSPFENKYPAAELEKDYLKCQYCERTFRRQKNLENHIENTHHGKSPQRKKPGEANDMYFKCTHCPYTTKHQSNLYVHLRIHTGERPYICGACGVQYSQSHSLKSHIINKHDGIMSYYIKEKRNRSPRGIGYLTTQHMPGDSPVFKMPASPMFPGNMPGLPGGPPNSLHLQHSPQQQPPHLAAAGFQHSPQHHQMPGAGGMPHNNMGSVPHSPVISPRGPQSQQQSSPGSAPGAPGTQQAPGQQMSPQQLQHRPPFPPMPHIMPDGMDATQKSLELAKLGFMNFPYYGKPFHNKLSPTFHMNGHGPISPQYNGMDLQMRQQAEQMMRNGGGPNPNTPQQQAAQQFRKSPLQEIHENKIQDENGAIDLTKKGKEEALDLALCDKKNNCTEDNPNCKSCLHLLKLKMLRMNVVRMLGILVPNLNFEEKGINAEGDSVDDLLRDVIESNIHDEESND